MSICTLLPLDGNGYPGIQRSNQLVDILEEAYQVSGKQTKNSILNVPLGKLSWGKAHLETFRSMHSSILNYTKLSYPKKEKVLCLFTDASDRFWSG